MCAESCDSMSSITSILGNFSRLKLDFLSGVNIPHSSSADLSQHVPLVLTTRMNYFHTIPSFHSLYIKTIQA